MKKHALHALLAVNAALALLLAWLWIDKAGHLRNIHWQPPAPQTSNYAAMVPVLPGLAPADTSQFIAMLDRPLFSPTRRPPPPPPPPSPLEQEPADNLGTAQLSGLFQGQGDGGAILQIAGKPRRVRLRESVEGWTLSAVRDRSATFTRGGQSRVLQLPRAALTSAPAHLPAANAPAPRAAAMPPGAPPQQSQDAAAAASQPPAEKAPPRATFGGRMVK